MDHGTRAPQGALLVWCDGDADLSALNEAFWSKGWRVDAVESVAQAAAARQRDTLCVVVCDDPERTRLEVALPGSEQRGLPVIAAVRQGDVTRGVMAMRLGAMTVVELRPGERLPRASVLMQAIDEFVKPAKDWRVDDPSDAIVRAPDSPLLGMIEVLAQIARSDSPVLIMGESGVGKSLFARTIHRIGARSRSPFVSLNCSALPASLLESELFVQLVAAQGGTLFLNEVGELPASSQARLLAALREGAITPSGALEAQAIEVRVIAATRHGSPDARSASGALSEDLYEFLNTLPIELPALRDHPQDIAPLCDHFIAQHHLAHGTLIAGVTHETRSLLKRYAWPGNVRELEHLITRLCARKKQGFIERDDLPDPILNAPPAAHFGLDMPSEGIDMTDTLDRLERNLLSGALKKADGNKARAARLLGINRTTFVEKLKRKNIV